MVVIETWKSIASIKSISNLRYARVQHRYNNNNNNTVITKHHSDGEMEIDGRIERQKEKKEIRHGIALHVRRAPDKSAAARRAKCIVRLLAGAAPVSRLSYATHCTLPLPPSCHFSPLSLSRLCFIPFLDRTRIADVPTTWPPSSARPIIAPPTTILPPPSFLTLFFLICIFRCYFSPK